MRFTFDDLVAVMARLRGADGCPWDRQQTHASLAPYVLEEAHEVLDAISRDDRGALRDELGDLLLQVVFHGQMSAEAGSWTAGDVVDGLTRKLIERHPHVFGDTKLGTPAEVLAQWHELKRREAPGRGVFDGIPTSLPALARAQKVLHRAMVNGMTAQVPGEPLEAASHVAERLHRVMAAVAMTAGEPAPGPPQDGDKPEASPPPKVDEEFGELLLAVAALAATVDVDAESALRAACQKFLARISAG
ncbi:MAG: nucleoside triphosphate pyrophosphohydrolase [Armatimonadota bacterium]|nr:nucleoside triphosphate pyrophosphohydrolase [Armatimonadota bacterium]